MSLEEEALRNAGTHPVARSKEAKPPSTFDRLVRFVATVLLLGLLTVVYWVPMALMDGYFAAAFVLAVLTMLGAGVASRLYHLRVRVQALEAVLDDEDRRAPTSPVPLTTGVPSAPTSQPGTLEEIQNKP